MQSPYFTRIDTKDIPDCIESMVVVFSFYISPI